MTDITRTVTQYKALDDETPEPDAWAHARNMLVEQFRANGEVMDTDPVPSDPVPVVVDADMTGWTTTTPDDPALTGHVVTWTATGHAVATEEYLDGGLDAEGRFVVRVPNDHRLLHVHGGPVRVRHGLGGPVTVTTYGNNGSPVGYLFAQEVSDDEVAVELYQHTNLILVTPDPQEPGS